MSGRVILDYHERTKHSYESVREGGSGLDWANEPSAFKEYVGVAKEPLPRFSERGVRAVDAIAGVSRSSETRLDVDALSFLLFHAAGVSRVIRSRHGEWRFRTYASAGALYPNELYVVSGEVEGLDPGVYHYEPNQHALGRLRDADLRAALGPDWGGASVVVSGIPWRTTWKYGARGFRHLYWDAGMIVANLLASAAAAGIEATVRLAFADAEVNRVVGVDERDEFALCIVTLGTAAEPPPEADVAHLSLAVEPISPRPRRDPPIEKARHAIALDPDAVAAFRAAAGEPAARHGDMIERDEGEGESSRSGQISIEPLARDALSPDTLERVIRRRGSSRELDTASFPAAEYGAIQDLALADVSGDWGSTLVSVHVIANALGGISPGAYAYRRGGSFAPVHQGEMRRKAGFVCLEQRLGAEAAAVVVLTADIETAVERLGPRGYVAAQLEAAIVAGRLYLGAYAQCLGASGITFYDDEARRLFETDEEPMLAFVLGPEGARRSVIRCRQRFDTVTAAPAPG